MGWPPPNPGGHYEISVRSAPSLQPSNASTALTARLAPRWKSPFWAISERGWNISISYNSLKLGLPNSRKLKILRGMVMKSDEWCWLTLKRVRCVTSSRRASAEVAVTNLATSCFLPFHEPRPAGGRWARVPNELHEVDADAFMRYPKLTIYYNLPFVNRYKA